MANSNLVPYNPKIKIIAIITIMIIIIIIIMMMVVMKMMIYHSHCRSYFTKWG